MSAIYGGIDLKGNRVDESLPERMHREYAGCRIDRHDALIRDNVFMACELQFFYPRAQKELLPKYDEGSRLFFTADCVLDNRKRLIEELGMDQDAPDGDVIFASYKRWGMDCVHHLEGLFSFVVYDAEKNEIYAAVDQFAQRCLFYHVRDGVFYFSSLLFPLVKGTGLEFEKNERWLLDTVSMRSPLMVTETKETVANGVYKIESGTYLTVKIGDGDEDIVKEEKRYYAPYDEVKTDWSITPEQSEQMVKDAMFSALEDILNEQGDVAAQLSSGLDSSTVACVAARLLEKTGNKVYSYTSVPLKEANLKSNRFTLYDESVKVKLIGEKYPNIESTFVDCNGRDYMQCAEEIIDLWELPCKSQQNAVWIDEIYRLASERGCRIILAGSTGNCTLSAGDYQDVAVYYLKKLRFSKAFHMMDTVKDGGISRKRFVKTYFGEACDYYKWYFDPKRRDQYKHNVTKRSLGEKYDMNKRLGKLYHSFPIKSMDKMHEQMYMPMSYAQLGEFEVKSSLRYGILTRDPMRTVGFIKLCYTLPIFCYAQKDFDRRLVRAGMRGIVPDEICTDVFNRGRQSGDNVYRIKKDWPELRDKWKSVVYSEQVLHYLDKDKLDTLSAKCFDDMDNLSEMDALLVSDLYSFGLYVSEVCEIMNK